MKIDNSRYIASLVDTFENIESLARRFTYSLIVSPGGRMAIGDHPVTFLFPGIDFGAYGLPFGGKTIAGAVHR